MQVTLPRAVLELLEPSDNLTRRQAAYGLSRPEIDVGGLVEDLVQVLEEKDRNCLVTPCRIRTHGESSPDVPVQASHHRRPLRS